MKICTVCKKEIDEMYLTRLGRPYHNECYVGKDLTNDFMDTIGIVKSMRYAQKDYFKNRSKSALHESIKLEREVDESLEYYKTCNKSNNNRIPNAIQSTCQCMIADEVLNSMKQSHLIYFDPL